MVQDPPACTNQQTNRCKCFRCILLAKRRPFAAAQKSQKPGFNNPNIIKVFADRDKFFSPGGHIRLFSPNLRKSVVQEPLTHFSMPIYTDPQWRACVDVTVPGVQHLFDLPGF